jgi:hypothetical protein
MAMVFASKGFHDVSDSTFEELERHKSAFSRRDPPEVCASFPRKTEGVGNAGCPMHPQPRVQSEKAHEHSHHRSTEITRHSRTRWF